MLSALIDNRVSHVMIRCKDGKHDVGGGQQFSGLNELIEHYKKIPLVEITGDEFIWRWYDDLHKRFVFKTAIYDLSTRIFP